MALGIAYLKLGDLPQAKEYSTQALAVDASNPVALKNLGEILGQEGDSLRALYYLCRPYEADPRDPQAVHGLAFALGRHRAGPKSLPDGAEDACDRGAARPGQERALGRMPCVG